MYNVNLVFVFLMTGRNYAIVLCYEMNINNAKAYFHKKIGSLASTKPEIILQSASEGLTSK